MENLYKLGKDTYTLKLLAAYRRSDQPRVTVLNKGDRLFQRFFYVIRGNALFTDGQGNSILARPGSVVFFPHDCEYVCNWTDCEECEFMGVHFVIYDDNGAPLNLSSKIMPVARDSSGKLLDILTDIYENWISGANTSLVCMSLFYKLLSELERGLEAEDKNSVLGVINYLENHYCDEISTRELADMCGMGSTLFRMRFKEITGISPVKFKNRLRMRKAAMMLRYGEYTISEVAEMLGLCDVYYFSKMFKDEWGMSPREYKRSLD